MPSLAKGFIRGGGQSLALDFQWLPDPMIVANQLEGLADYYNDMLPPLAATAAITSREIRKRFATETDPDGTPWKPWAESYAPYAEEHNFGILKQTGELMRAAPDESRFLLSSYDVVYSGADLPHYCLAHNEGISRTTRSHKQRADLVKAGYPEMADTSDLKKNVLPARPFIGLGEEARFEVLEAWEAWFQAGIFGLITQGRAYVLGTLFPVIGRLRTGQPIARTPRGPRFATFSLRR